MNRRSSFYKAGIIVLLILILLASLGIAGVLFLRLHDNAPAAGALAINSAFFINSGQLTRKINHGINKLESELERFVRMQGYLFL